MALDVSLVKCEDYNEKALREKIEKCLSNIGGLEKFIKRGDRVLLKPNLLAPCAPEQCVTTHPIFVKVVADTARELGANVKVGDSPAGNVQNHIGMIWEKTGMTKAVSDMSELVKFERESCKISLENAEICNEFYISKEILSADVIINLPKLKTHTGMFMTGAIKNCFGAMPGRIKSSMHLKYQDAMDFAKFLVDIAYYVNPTLTILDGVWGLQGDGPGAGGTPINTGIIMASADILAMDMAIADIVGINPFIVPTNLVASNRKDCKVKSLDDVNIIREDDINIEKFNMPSQLIDSQKEKNVLMIDTRVPKIDNQKCVKCNTCVGSCPVEAIYMDNENSLLVDIDKCISCYCCFEVCVYNCIKLKRKYTLDGDKFVLNKKY